MVKEQGFDLDSLLFLCKNLFGILNDIKLTNQEISSFMSNLKSVYDAREGKMNQDDNYESPLKITVTNTLTNSVAYFTLCNIDPAVPKFCCELCAAALQKTELKKHIIDHESSILAS